MLKAAEKGRLDVLKALLEQGADKESLRPCLQSGCRRTFEQTCEDPTCLKLCLPHCRTKVSDLIPTSALWCKRAVKVLVTFFRPSPLFLTRWLSTVCLLGCNQDLKDDEGTGNHVCDMCP